jgi:hypothetical protein
VSAPPFYFALEFSSQGVAASLLRDLVAQVMQYVGCADAEVPELSDALERAVEKSAYGERRCDVQFRAQGGTLEILVSSNGGRVWQTSRAIP